MNGKILTPISLWKNFSPSGNFQPEISSAREKDGILYRDVSFWGRQSEDGKVRIYALEVSPAAREQQERLPALLLLPEAGGGVDEKLAERFARRGYVVFCMDYCGERAGGGLHTVYPADLSYANYVEARKALERADEGADKTAWYEWTAAAYCAVKYLSALPYVSGVGVMGVREGGDIAWKLMTLTELCCGVCVNAAGWLAYRGVDKFGAGSSFELDESGRLFVAGLDSQSYAPFVKCPVLMLVSTTDVYTDADRAYDTFVRINQDYFSTISYSVKNGGVIDPEGVKDIDMFMDGYMKDRQIFMPKPLNVSIEEEEGKTYAVLSADVQGEAQDCFVYFSENAPEECEREWIKVSSYERTEDGKKRFPLSVYGGAGQIFAFGKVRYSNGFTVCSKITFRKTEGLGDGGVLHSNILYDSSMEGDFFLTVDYEESVLGDCLWKEGATEPVVREGYGKIKGISCPKGLRTSRIALPRYAPQERALLHFSVYAEEDCNLAVSVVKRDRSGKSETYTCEIPVEGGGKWKNCTLEAGWFHNENGVALDEFYTGRLLQFVERSRKNFILNNILWV